VQRLGDCATCELLKKTQEIERFEFQNNIAKNIENSIFRKMVDAHGFRKKVCRPRTCKLRLKACKRHLSVENKCTYVERILFSDILLMFRESLSRLYSTKRYSIYLALGWTCLILVSQRAKAQLSGSIARQGTAVMTRIFFMVLEVICPNICLPLMIPANTIFRKVVDVPSFRKKVDHIPVNNKSRPGANKHMSKEFLFQTYCCCSRKFGKLFVNKKTLIMHPGEPSPLGTTLLSSASLKTTATRTVMSMIVIQRKKRKSRAPTTMQIKIESSAQNKNAKPKMRATTATTKSALR